METEQRAVKIARALRKGIKAGITNPKSLGLLAAIELGNGRKRGRRVRRKKADSGKTA